LLVVDKPYYQFGFQLQTRDESPVIGVKYPLEKTDLLKGPYMAPYTVTAVLIMNGDRSNPKNFGTMTVRDSLWGYDSSIGDLARFSGKEV
jgi:hypothetical protein